MQMMINVLVYQRTKHLSDYHYQFGGSYSGMLSAVDDYTPQACGCFAYGYYVNNGYHGLIGSPPTKNKGTFSDYHEHKSDTPKVLVSGPWNYGREPSGLFTDGDFGYNNVWETVGSRLTNEPGYLFGLSLGTS